MLHTVRCESGPILCCPVLLLSWLLSSVCLSVFSHLFLGHELGSGLLGSLELLDLLDQLLLFSQRHGARLLYRYKPARHTQGDFLSISHHICCILR